jgi:hypothetical protein
VNEHQLQMETIAAEREKHLQEQYAWEKEKERIQTI